MPELLTPGLTRLQAEGLRLDLIRLTGMPAAVAIGIYADADRIAGRYLMSPHAADHLNAQCTIAALLADHRHDRQLVAYIAGLAHGVRLGRRFIKPPPPRSKWISDEYKRLTEPSRRDVQKYIRRMLKAQEPRRPPAPSADVEIAAAQDWTRHIGRLARGTP